MTDNNVTGPTGPSFVPPAGSVQFGNSNTLAPSVKLQPRKIVGVGPGVAPPTLEEQTQQGYTGQLLVDEKGILSRGQYNEDEAFTELVAFGNPAERLQFLNTLAAVGIYGNRKPSGRITDTDLNAVREAMLYANEKGVTLKVAAQLMAVDPLIAKQMRVSGAGRVRTTAKQDLRAVFKQVSANVLGRDLSDAEVEKFVRSYNQMETAEAYGGAAAPSAQVAAEEAVRGSAPEEAGAMQLLGYANVIDQLMKGLG